MVMGVLGFTVPVLGSAFGLPLGFTAYRRIRGSDGQLSDGQRKGMKLATAGIVLNGVGLAIWFIIIIFIAWACSGNSSCFA